MNRIVQIRGTSGSGKTWLIYQLMEKFNANPILKENGKVEGYLLDNNIRVVGRYETACGGCDTIRDKEEAPRLVRKYAALGHVIFEGLLISGVWGRWYELSQEYPGQYLWLFMDTPLEVCHDRVLQRNGGKPINRDNLKGKFRAVELAQQKAEKFGEEWSWINHTRPFEHLMEILTPALEGKVLPTPKVSPPEEAQEAAESPSPSESTQVYPELSLF